MDRGRAEGQSIGQITSGINQGNTLALKTIDFVRRQLPAWRKWRDDCNQPDERLEEKLNSQLCKFLEARARNDFPMVLFHHEEPQTGRHRADISAGPSETTVIGVRQYTIDDPILVFECKRLQKEYVTGGIKRQSGGIQRFKLGLHGADHDIVGMIGYVQEHSARDWHHKINKWISNLSLGIITDGCAWNDSETLELLEEDIPTGIASYQSVHTRTGSMSSNEIIIHHLWVAMNTG